MPGRRIFRLPSDAPMLHASVKPVPLFSAELIQFSMLFEFFLRVLFCMAFLLHPWDLEMLT